MKYGILFCLITYLNLGIYSKDNILLESGSSEFGKVPAKINEPGSLIAVNPGMGKSAHNKEIKEAAENESTKKNKKTKIKTVTTYTKGTSVANNNLAVSLKDKDKNLSHDSVSNNNKTSEDTAGVTSINYNILKSSSSLIEVKVDSSQINLSSGNKILEKGKLKKGKKNSDTDFEIDNLLLNETITKTGKDFYDLFYKNWAAPDGKNNLIIIIGEKPMPSIGTKIFIKINDYYIYQRVLQPGYETIKQAANDGVNMAQSFVNNYDMIQKNLEGKDLQGTGVY